VRRIALGLAAAMVLGCAAAQAAGIDSRAYSCGQLHSLIGAYGYVFIAQPMFGDFVVANRSFCSGGEVPQLRSVPTVDTAQCPVNYCVPTNQNLLR